MKTNFIIATTCLVLAGAAIPSHAAVVTAIQLSDPGDLPPSPIVAVSGDLLETSVSSAINENTAANLRNGSTGTAFEASVTNPANPATSSPFETTFHLDISTNAFGYNITEFRLFSGWSDDRAGQKYTIAYSLVGSASFTDFTSVTSLQNYRSVLTRTYDDTSAPLISGVDAVRFTVSDPIVLNSASRTVYREIDVLGTATVPEPSTALLGGLGLGLLALLRRRRA